MKHAERVVSAGSEDGGFTIRKDADGFAMTGSTAEGTAEDDAYFFPPTRASSLAELLDALQQLPGWNPIPVFTPVFLNPAYRDELDAACAALWPELWRERRTRWLAPAALGAG